MYQDNLREKLNKVLEKGLPAKVVATAVGATTVDISRFKNRQICLIDNMAKKLEEYLEKVNLP